MQESDESWAETALPSGRTEHLLNSVFQTSLREKQLTVLRTGVSVSLLWVSVDLLKAEWLRWSMRGKTSNMPGKKCLREGT